MGASACFGGSESRIDYCPANGRVSKFNKHMYIYPTNQIELIEMMYWEGYSLSEIASQKNEPVGTVKSRLHQCLKILRKHLTSLREG